MEIIVTQTQVEDSTDLLASAAEQNYGPGEANSHPYVPDQSQVPRPSFASLENYMQLQSQSIAMAQPERRNNRLVVRPEQSAGLTHFQGLRGIAKVLAPGPNGTPRRLSGPAIVLDGGTHIAMLTAEAPAADDTISPMQHALLEAEYVKHLAEVSAQHSDADVRNPGDIAPALVVASSTGVGTAHGELHVLADTTNSTFGSNFGRAGRQDIQTAGHQTRRVISAIVPVGKASLHFGERDQLAPQQLLLGVGLSSGQLAVSMTLAATQTRIKLSDAGHKARLRDNFNAMTAL